MNSYKNHKALAFAGSLIPFLGISVAAYAQTSNTEGQYKATQIEEIIVSARKRAESIQDVPVTVTAFDSKRLESMGFRNLQDISFAAPNVVLDSVGSNKSSAAFTIRGLTATSSIQSLEPAVAVFVDGVYMSANAGIVTDSYDIESIEVLRGPQGTLFGRNVTGGAVLINTKNPSQEFGFDAMAGLEEGPEYRVGMAVTGGLTETVSARMAMYYRDDSGFMDNVAPDLNPSLAHLDGEGPETETLILRPSILWEPSEGLSFLAKYEHMRTDGDMMWSQNLANFDGNEFEASVDEPGFSETEVDSLTLQLDWETEAGTLTNVFNYRQMEDIFLTDIDGTRLHIFHTSVFTGIEQISNELRFTGKVGKLDYTAGIYLFDAELKAMELRSIASNAVRQSGGGVQDTLSLAAFTEMSYHFTDKFSGIFGLRYTVEEKDANISEIGPALSCGFVYPIEGDVDCRVDAVDSDEWNLLGFKIGGQYEFSDQMQGYAHLTRGFRSGGYNIRDAFSGSPVLDGSAPPPFDEEELNALEIGLKSDWLDGRARTNIALFWNDADDLQRDVQISVPGPVPTVQVTANSADATFKGIEFEGSLELTDNLLLSASFGYIDFEYDKLLYDISGDGILNDVDKGLTFPRMPETTWGVGFVHTMEFAAGGVLTSRLNYDYRDDQFFTDNNLGPMPEVEMLTARIGYAMTNGFTVSVYGRNLLDEVVYGGMTPLRGLLDSTGALPIYPAPGAGAGFGTLSPIVQDGRTFGIELSYSL